MATMIDRRPDPSSVTYDDLLWAPTKHLVRLADFFGLPIPEDDEGIDHDLLVAALHVLMTNPEPIRHRKPRKVPYFYRASTGRSYLVRPALTFLQEL